MAGTVAPTVIATGVRDGDAPQASTLLFPARTTVVIPALTRLVTAVSKAIEGLFAKMLMLATAG